MKEQLFDETLRYIDSLEPAQRIGLAFLVLLFNGLIMGLFLWLIRRTDRMDQDTIETRYKKGKPAGGRQSGV